MRDDRFRDLKPGQTFTERFSCPRCGAPRGVYCMFTLGDPAVERDERSIGDKRTTPHAERCGRVR